MSTWSFDCLFEDRERVGDSRGGAFPFLLCLSTVFSFRSRNRFFCLMLRIPIAASKYFRLSVRSPLTRELNSHSLFFVFPVFFLCLSFHPMYVCDRRPRVFPLVMKVRLAGRHAHDNEICEEKFAEGSMDMRVSPPAGGQEWQELYPSCLSSSYGGPRRGRHACTPLQEYGTKKSNPVSIGFMASTIHEGIQRNAAAGVEAHCLTADFSHLFGTLIPGSSPTDVLTWETSPSVTREQAFTPEGLT